MTTPLPAEKVTAATDLRDRMVTGDDDLVALWRDHARVCDETKPDEPQYWPLRAATAGQVKYALGLLARRGATVRRDDNDVAALAPYLHKGRLSALIDELRARAGDGAQTEQQRRDAVADWQVRKRLERPIRGLDLLPFELTDSQRAYIDKVRVGDLRSAAPIVRIVGHNEHGDVRVHITYGRGRYARAYTRWVRRRPPRQ